jgi:hypothetical protein
MADGRHTPSAFNSITKQKTMKPILLLLVLAALAVTGCQKDMDSNSSYHNTNSYSNTNSMGSTTNSP